MNLLMEDYILLSRLPKKDLDAKAVYSPKTLQKQHPEAYKRLIATEYMAPNGGLRPEALAAVKKVLVIETKLKKGIPLKSRTSANPGTIITHKKLEWFSKKFKKQYITANAFFAYLGKPHHAMNRKNHFMPSDKELVNCLIPPKTQSYKLTPYAYQIESFEGAKLIWFKYENDGTVAIQAFYYDFLQFHFKGSQFFTYHNDSRIFIAKPGIVNAMVMPFITHMHAPKI